LATFRKSPSFSCDSAISNSAVSAAPLPAPSFGTSTGAGGAAGAVVVVLLVSLIFGLADGEKKQALNFVPRGRESCRFVLEFQVFIVLCFQCVFCNFV
jgi:hypothetical protein